MEAKAIARFVRVTPRKADQVLQLIRGKRVDQVTEILDFTPKAVAKIIGKVLKSAVANAVAIEHKINVEELRVKSATAGAGPTMKRFLPRAQGRATPILKRTCHITVVVEGDVVEDPTTTRRARRVAPKAAKPAESKTAKTAKVEEPPAPASKKAAKKAQPKKAAAKTKKSKEAK
ncbi:MAG: 50S ribosomal protein L22 [Candidatus Eiseniibacteriota bacterium]